jgi:hypothetical protein
MGVVMGLANDIVEAEEALKLAHKALQDITRRLSSFELLSGDNPIVKTDWRPRDEVPPKGHVWASDGSGVWLIHSDGTLIPDYAAKVKFWTQAFIPCPPDHRQTIDATVNEKKPELTCIKNPFYVQVPTEYCGTPGSGGAGGPGGAGGDGHCLFERKLLEKDQTVEFDGSTFLDLHNSLTAFVEAKLRSSWLEFPEFKVYVRKSIRALGDFQEGYSYKMNQPLFDCLDLASIEVYGEHRRQGIFGNFLSVMEQVALKEGYQAVMVESVSHEWLKDSLVRRGYNRRPSAPDSFWKKP